MNNTWILLGTGVFFCISGIWFFFRNIFEENRSVKGAVILMLMGVILITIASARLLPARGRF
jgi:hypothetical protein